MSNLELFAPPPALAPWWERPFASLDFEATAPDCFSGRPVSYAYVIVDGAGKVEYADGAIINCGVDSSDEAIAVHGLTNERVRSEGVTPGWAVEQIASAIHNARMENMPVVIMNARFDWPLLLEEAKRQHQQIEPVELLDPSMLDKGMDRYRKGKRRLTDLCAHYGVELVDAHTAVADAIAAARLARGIIRRWPRLQVENPAALNVWQARVFEEYRSFLCSDGSRHISKGWPIPASE
jgi:DNA polymerase III subunit epsilon